MQTIQRLCKYKDITDVVYKCLHQMLTRDLIVEFRALAKIEYYFEGSDDTDSDNDCVIYDADETYFPVLYGVNPQQHACFNWRLIDVKRRRFPIYHISHTQQIVYRTNVSCKL